MSTRLTISIDIDDDAQRATAEFRNEFDDVPERIRAERGETGAFRLTGNVPEEIRHPVTWSDAKLAFAHMLCDQTVLAVNERPR